jgi:ABC-type oligopeptide transport system substrate-binding subunit
MVGNAAGVPFGVELNGSRGIFQDIRVRRAFAMAIDRKDLADNLFFGLIDASFGPLSTTTPTYWKGVEDYYQPNEKASGRPEDWIRQGVEAAAPSRGAK